MADDGPKTPEKEAEERRTAQRNLIRAYKRLFATDDGRLVLADLADKFGEDKQEYVYGCTAMDLSFRTGLRQHIRHIRKMKAMELQPLGAKPKRRSAKSGLAPRS